MARIKTTTSANSKSYSIIEDYKRNGKRTTRVIDKIGNYNMVSEKAKEENISVKEWLDNYLKKFLENRGISKEVKEVIIKKNANKLIPKNERFKFNVGYLFLKDIYYSLKINKIINEISKKYKFKFDLNEVFECLVYSRIIYPSSKLRTYELSKNFIETPKCYLENIYRGLSYLNKDFDYIQKEIYKNSKSVIDRDTRILYFDCTNFYFSINEETDLKKYGKGKDHQPKPLVGMGLFMDGNGIPIAINIFPGNENETKHLIPLQEKIASEYDLSQKKTIICTDAAMCTDDIKNFNIKDGRAFVITQSIKKLKKVYKDKVFEDGNWRIVGELNKTYKLSDILEDDNLKEEYYNTVFYKIIQTETAHVVQDLIVTFQIKYRDYLRNVRNGQIERAKKKISSSNKGEKIKLTNNPNDYRRLIKEDISEIKKKRKSNNKDEKNSLNEDSKKTKYSYSYSINTSVIEEEEKYDGYYGITTNLTGEIKDILKISKNRWEIEESFRIMKTDFDTGTIYLSREDRIKAHFLTCFVSLIIFRIIENKLEYNYTDTKIIDKLRDMDIFEEKGTGYSPAYIRDDLTDDLHKAFGFRTDYEIMTYKKIDNILKKIKKI